MHINIPDDADINKLPSIVQYLIAANFLNQGVGLWALEKGIAECPEFFVDLIEARRKWALVPEEVKDAYYKDLSHREHELYAECKGGGGGLFTWLNQTPESITFDECLRSKGEQRKKIAREVHDKYLAAYGIDFTKQ